VLVVRGELPTCCCRDAREMMRRRPTPSRSWCRDTGHCPMLHGRRAGAWRCGVPVDDDSPRPSRGEGARMTPRSISIVSWRRHNGLVVRVLPRRAQASRCACSSAARGGRRGGDRGIPSGFRNSTASYTVSLLNPKVIRDLRLAEHGLRVGRAAVLELPAASRTAVHHGSAAARGDAARSGALLARDAERCRLLRRAWTAWPTCCASCCWRRRPTSAAACRTSSARGSGPRDQRAADAGQARRARPLHAVGGGLARPLVRVRPIKACFGFDSVVGNFASPYARARPTCCCTTCSAR
jgi:hypothetical protein